MLRLIFPIFHHTLYEVFLNEILRKKGLGVITSIFWWMKRKRSFFFGVKDRRRTQNERLFLEFVSQRLSWWNKDSRAEKQIRYYVDGWMNASRHFMERIWQCTCLIATCPFRVHGSKFQDFFIWSILDFENIINLVFVCYVCTYIVTHRRTAICNIV